MEPKRTVKSDLYNKGAMFDKMYERLTNNSLFLFPENNRLIKIFIDSKQKGYYRSIIYDVNSPKLTLAKNLSSLKKVEECLNKQFDMLTQSDIDDFQQRLNNNCILTTTKQLHFRNQDKPISHEYKLDLVNNLKQFWRFYRLYSKYELQKEIPDIVEYFRIRRSKRNNEMIAFLTKEELELLCKSISSQQMIAFFNVFFETGARVIEILKLKYSNCIFNNEKKTWIIKLPNEKGKSTSKVPVELTFSAAEFDRWITSRKFLEDDYVFQYSYDYVRKRLSFLSRRVLGRHITCKEFRKGMAMYLVNCNINEQYIRAHMGWAASSKAIAHYINQKAIKRPDLLDKAIQTDFYSDVIKENQDLKFKQKIQEDELQKMKEEMDAFKKEQLRMFDKMNDINVSASKNLIKAVFEEMQKKPEKEFVGTS